MIWWQNKEVHISLHRQCTEQFWLTGGIMGPLGTIDWKLYSYIDSLHSKLKCHVPAITTPHKANEVRNLN